MQCTMTQFTHLFQLDFEIFFFRFSAARTCFDLKNSGVTSSGVYYLDPDGIGSGTRPIQVCNKCIYMDDLKKFHGMKVS